MGAYPGSRVVFCAPLGHGTRVPVPGSRSPGPRSNDKCRANVSESELHFGHTAILFHLTDSRYKKGCILRLRARQTEKCT
eukprot:2044813-Rhodomonas_salina.2